MFTYRVDDEIDIRILEPHHAEALYALTERNRMFLSKWLMWADDIRSVENSRAFIEQGLRQNAENDGFQAGIWVADELAGCIGFHGVDWSNRNTEIGYWLGEAYTGRGIMTRACRAVITHAFDVWHLHRVVIRCAIGNLQSRAVAERLGFHQDGVNREELWLYDRYVDHVVYSMLEYEWRRE